MALSPCTAEGEARSPDTPRRAASGRASAVVLVLAFFGLGLVSLVRHELWRDELEVWDAARTSHSLLELRESIRYIGQPPLWPLCLFGLTRVTDDPRAMQLLNLALVTLAVGIVATRAPFTPVQKWLFAFGYLPLFEYGTISRHYGLGLLLLVAWCATWTRRPRLGIANGLLLALLAFAHFHATLVAIAALAAIGLDRVLDRKPPRTIEWVSAAGVGLAIGAAVYLAVPPADSDFLRPFQFDPDPRRFVVVAAHLWRGYAPVPPWIHHFWNLNILDAWPTLEAGLGLALATAFGWGLRRQRLALLLFAGGTAALFLFCYAQLAGHVRNDGMFFLVLVAGLWLGSRAPHGVPRWASGLFTGVLALQLAAGLMASWRDWTLPFSMSGAAAEALRAPELAELPVVGDYDFAAAAVAARLQRPMFLPAMGRFATRVVWRNDRHAVSRAELGTAVRRIQRASHQDVLLLLDHGLDPVGRFEKLRCFEGAIVRNENYCLYRAPLQR